MADPRLAIHQNFDLLRCKLCNRVYQEPKLLPCLHSFCLDCLQKYVNENIAPSESTFSCPTCQESVDLPPVGGVSSLTTNHILKRYVDQTKRDQTMKVAGREVLEMQKQALTEEELHSPVVMTTIENIAMTAGHVIANGMAERNKVHSFETIKYRQDLQTRAKRLQDQSIGIVHCIDHVNQQHKDWMDTKSKMREIIKTRSAKIQDTIRSIERDLLSRLDDLEDENNVKDEVHRVKTTLHRTLKANLTAADFIRLLKEHGNYSDIESCMPLVEEQEQKLLNNKIYMSERSFGFDYPRVDLQNSIELMFGTLSEISEENIIWDPADFEITDSTLKSVFDQKSTYTAETDAYALENSPRSEADLTEEYDNVSWEGGSKTGLIPLNKSEEARHSFQHRRPLKSMSFDASMTSSWEPAFGSLSSNRSGYHLVYETDDMNNNVNNENDDDNEHSNTISSLHPGIDLLTGQRSGIRRGSAPPSMIIDTLTRRRLSALSILERANINTEGLLSTSDIESGLSQARMEWLRENVKRKTDSERRASFDVNT